MDDTELRDLLDDEPPPNEKSLEERVRNWARLMREDAERRRPTKTPIRWLASSMVYLCIFSAAALILCFVLWVASCTLQAMKGF